MTISGGRAPPQGPPRPSTTPAPTRQLPSHRVPVSGPREASTSASEESCGDPVRDALVVARRYGAALNGLLSAVDSFARGVEIARSANDAFSQKLERMQELVSTEQHEEQARHGELERRVHSLEQKLRSQRQAFETERRFLTDEQDDFLRALLDEHEEQMEALREERDAALALASTATTRSTGAPGADEPRLIESLRREIANLRADRESSRALAQRMRVQRDQAQAALLSLETQPPAAEYDSLHPTTPAPPPFAGEAVHVPLAPRAPVELAEGLLGGTERRILPEGPAKCDRSR